MLKKIGLSEGIREMSF